VSNNVANLIVLGLIALALVVAYLRAVLSEQDERDGRTLAAQIRQDRIADIARRRLP
jgi:hypothetical protein